MTSSSPTVSAAAPSPHSISAREPAFVRRCSEAMIISLPGLALSSPAISAEVAARCDEPMSMVLIWLLRFMASATSTEFCRSTNGAVVEARFKPDSDLSCSAERQSIPASTAIVMVSSSQLQILRSPLPRPFRLKSNQALASTITCRFRRSLGK